jgi:hypothetical protein
MNDKYRLVLSDDEACRRVRDFVKSSAFYAEHYGGSAYIWISVIGDRLIYAEAL